jgi:hypothetical protein
MKEKPLINQIYGPGGGCAAANPIYNLDHKPEGLYPSGDPIKELTTKTKSELITEECHRQMEEERPSRENLKFDAGKLDYTLLEPFFLQEMAKIMTLGEKNHPKVGGEPSWRLVEQEAYLKALLRHIQAYRLGERVDQEMGTKHLAHAAVNAMFVMYFDMLKEKEEESNGIRRVNQL